MHSELSSRDMYIRLTDPSGKHKPVINQHLVWDAETFIEAQIDQYGRNAKPEDQRVVSVATRAEYLAYRAAGRH